jgi:ferredoxin
MSHRRLMKQRLAALALALLGMAILLASAQGNLANWLPLPLAITAGAILLLLSMGILASAFSSQRDLLQLNWFVPFLRKKKNPPTYLFVRCIQWVLPASWFADRDRGRPGKIRTWLKWVGPSLLSSPLRRVVQASCLAVFLLLFFYVCWPYHAKPVAAGRVATDLKFIEIDQESGDLEFDQSQVGAWRPAMQQSVFLTKASSHPDDPGQFIPIVGTVSQVTSSAFAIAPTEVLTDAQFDQLFTFNGQWELHESDPNAWPSHYAESLKSKEWIPADVFLSIDPLVSLSTAIASRSWVWSLTSAGVILLICVLIPRGFCGYLCPLGTVIDLFDWAVAGRISKFRVPGEGWWVHIKYYLLASILICATFGVLISGIFAAIPVVTRAFLFIGEPLQTAAFRELHQVAPMNFGQTISIALFVVILSLGFLRPRFWCKYVCPSGAVFSIGNLFRVTERKVESSCINCNRCVEICPFDAIKPDFTTRTSDCTLCQTCGGVCPTHAIKFVERWNLVDLKTQDDPPTHETAIGRRGFLSLTAGTAASVAGGIGIAAATKAFGANLQSENPFYAIRPPGSVPEEEFLQMCIRCGECFKACPNNVLQAEGFQQGLEGLWSPLVNADWAGCESSCNACGQVCPTGAIRALPLEEKKVARMGLAIVDQQTCLPFAGREACQLCVDECNAAGYRAIEFTQVLTETDQQGQPIPDTGFLAPLVQSDKCVGCGLCQTRCHAINVKEKKLLKISAIVVAAGPGNEDRLRQGSYLQLRQAESEQRANNASDDDTEGKFFIPGEQIPAPETTEDDPFGLGGF